MAFKLTEKQSKANDVLGSDAQHILLFGGSRSGKTFLIVRAIVIRALARKSRHAILRFRFNAVKQSIIHQTLPDVMERCFPGVAERSKMDKQDWFYTLPSGSEIWFGGLDDKERTEKILGSEYASLYFNECSQIPYASRNVAITRLAQKVDGLRARAFYDCNPPSDGHWTNKLFIQKRDPISGQPLRNPDDFVAFGPMNPNDNKVNLSADYLKQLEGLSEKDRRRFLLGQWGSANEAALWTVELLEQSRFDGPELPEMARVVVAVDPSGSRGKEDKRSDEVGIVVCGLGQDGKGYVLEDLSGRMAPVEWGRAAVSAFDRYSADCIVAEVNFGGEMVAEVIRTAAREGGVTRSVPFREVRASRGKAVRAEPIATLFEQEKVRLAGYFPVLEDQLCGMTTAGFVGDRSPDRADAMIWGLAHLFPAMTRREESNIAPPRVVLGYAGAKRMPGSSQPKVILRR